MHASKMLVLRLSPTVRSMYLQYMSLATPGDTPFVPLTSHFSWASELTGCKSTSVMKELGSEHVLIHPLPPPHLYHWGHIGTSMYQQGAYEQEKWSYRILVSIYPFGEQMRRRQRCSTGTWIVPRERALVQTFWKCAPPQNGCPLVLTLNAEPGFLHFKEPGPFKLT